MVEQLPRAETDEGRYHVIARGNYRYRVFADDGAKGAFEKRLLEAAERFGWRLLAYCIMGYHCSGPLRARSCR